VRRKTKGSTVGPRWKLEAECVPVSGALKTYNNLWEGEKKEVPIQ
jgi:hypothetical protein